MSKKIILGKIAAEKDLDIKVVPKIKAELEEFDFNSDDISIVTDSDNEESVQEMRDQSSPVSKHDELSLVVFLILAGFYREDQRKQVIEDNSIGWYRRFK